MRESIARRLANQEPAFFGWAMAMNRWHDETGTLHLITRRGPGVTACGLRRIAHGGVEYTPEQKPDRGHACRTCLKARDAAAS